MGSYRFLLGPLRTQAAFLVVGVALIYVTGITPNNDGLQTAVAVAAGLSIGAIAFIVVLLFSRSPTKIGEVFRKRVQGISIVLGSLPIPAILALSLIVGASEELLFRGVLQGWLVENVHYSVGIILSAIIFGLLHFGSASTFIFTSLYGLMFGVAYHLTESIAFVMIWHAAYDFIALLFIAKAPQYFSIRQCGA